MVRVRVVRVVRVRESVVRIVRVRVQDRVRV